MEQETNGPKLYERNLQEYEELFIATGFHHILETYTTPTVNKELNHWNEENFLKEVGEKVAKLTCFLRKQNSEYPEILAWAIVLNNTWACSEDQDQLYLTKVRLFLMILSFLDNALAGNSSDYLSLVQSCPKIFAYFMAAIQWHIYEGNPEKVEKDQTWSDYFRHEAVQSEEKMKKFAFPAFMLELLKLENFPDYIWSLDAIGSFRKNTYADGNYATYLDTQYYRELSFFQNKNLAKGKHDA